MKRLFILTGLGGHVGNNIARMLLSHGHQVRGLALESEDVTMLYGTGLSVVRGDVRRIETMEPLFYGVSDDTEVIFIHTAGLINIGSHHLKQVEEVNVGGTRNVIDLCRRHHVRKLVYISSVHAIPEQPQGVTMTEVADFSPDSVEGAYAKTKAEATQLVLDAARDGLDAVVVHPSGIIGPDDYGKGHMTQMIESYLNGSLTACVEGGYDFVDVRDVAEGTLEAAKNGRPGECYILSGRYVSVRDLLDRLHEITGHRRISTVLPMWFARLTAPLAELFYRLRGEAPLYTRYSLFTLTSNSKFSSAKARRDLGYHVRDLNTTLRDTVLSLVRQGRVKPKKIPALRQLLAAACPVRGGAGAQP